MQWEQSEQSGGHGAAAAPTGAPGNGTSVKSEHAAAVDLLADQLGAVVIEESP